MTISLVVYRCNNLQKDDIDFLNYAMVYMPNVEVLNLSDNFLQDDGIRLLTFAFLIDAESYWLINLMLLFYKCSILLPYLVDKSECVTPLAELYLENCGLTCNGASQLFNVLAKLKVPLKSLSIADNSLTRLVIQETYYASFQYYLLYISISMFRC